MSFCDQKSAREGARIRKASSICGSLQGIGGWHCRRHPDWLWRQKSSLVCVQRSASGGRTCQLPEKTPACSDQEITKSTASFVSNSVNLFSP
jgi:hypothetical protein